MELRRLVVVPLAFMILACSSTPPTSTMGSQCGCWLWRAGERRPSERNAILFIEGGSSAATLNVSGTPEHATLVQPDDVTWWSGEGSPVAATYRRGDRQFRVSLVPGDDCPPDAPDGACESSPATGTIEIDGEVIALAGRCGC